MAVLFASAGCKRKIISSPQAMYDDAWLKIHRGDLAGAQAEIEAIHFGDSPADVEWRWRFQAQKAEALVLQDKCKEALTLLEANPPEQLASSDVAVWRRMTQGHASYCLNQFEDSQKYLQEAEGLARANHPALLGEVNLRQGTLASLRGDSSAAVPHYAETLRIARNQNDQFLEVSALGNLGLESTTLERYDEAVDWDRKALALSQSLGADGLTSDILGNMGWCYYEMGDYENALALLRQADELSAKANATSARVDWKIEIGNVYYHMQDYPSAERAYESALSLARTIDYQTALVECYENLSLLSLETRQLDSAQRYRDAAAILDRAHPNPSLELYFLVIGGRIEEMKSNYAEAGKLFESVVREPNAPTSVKWEAQSRLAEIYAAQSKRSDADRQFRLSLSTIENARRSIQTEELRLSFLSNAIEFYSNYIEFLISQRRIEDALEVAEVSRAQTLAEGLGLKSKISFPLQNFQPRQIARRFGATLLFYWLGREHSYLWTISPSALSLFTLPPASEIEPLVKSYREALLGPRDVLETSNPQGAKLYEMLIAPAQDTQRQNLLPPGSRVIILPDAALYALNFETLIVPTPKPHYWIDDAIVANANSLVLLAAAASSNEKAPKSPKLLLVGDPVSPTAEFPDLPQATTEMGNVERYFAAPERTVLSRQQATTQAYLDSAPAQFSYIHFVAHGTASRARPLDSAVILTRAGDSYKLYARDIVSHPLRAELVTISACHGTGERTYSGEGLVGLTWAFLRAGAHGVIAALWEVNDNSTPQLMDDLYSEIMKGTAPDAALRHAKLRLLRSGTVYQKPFYWAPFELYRGH